MPVSLHHSSLDTTDISQTVNIRCNNAGALGTGVMGTIAAGDKLTAHWKQVSRPFTTLLLSKTNDISVDTSSRLSNGLHGQMPQLGLRLMGWFRNSVVYVKKLSSSRYNECC